MIVTKKLKYDTPVIHMGDAPIRFVEEIKLLGVLIDSKLTFNNHVKYICRKALNLYKPVARTAKINWGLSSEIVRTIYVAVVEPIIMYAASVWAPATGKITVQNQLNTVQRGFAQKICKTYRTVSLNAALTLAGLLPLDLRIQEAAELYEAKHGRPPQIIRGRKVESRVSYLKAAHPAKEVEIAFACLEDLSEETIEEYSIEGVRIFTDGSKIEGKVGAALSCWKGESETMAKKYRLESYCTVFQAEMYALKQATAIALEDTDQTCVNIFTDSRSSLELLKNQAAFHPLAFEIRNNLMELKAKGKNTRLFWIRAHVGINGNERADQLAKEAAKYDKIKAKYSKCPISFIKRVNRETAVQKWDARYRNGETATVTKLFFPTVGSAYQVIKKISLTPDLVQIFTGHGGFAQYLYRFKCKDSPACVCDPGIEESVTHILFDCPTYGIARFHLEQQIQQDVNLSTLPTIMATKEKREAFLRFSETIAEKTRFRNKTR